MPIEKGIGLFDGIIGIKSTHQQSGIVLPQTHMRLHPGNFWNSFTLNQKNKQYKIIILFSKEYPWHLPGQPGSGDSPPPWSPPKSFFKSRNKITGIPVPQHMAYLL
jgi:hypothetical protein